ncbi:MAG TPA: nitronate monooxygenase [Solirubrobacterales bacterium]|jgi:NAD(P)H-dependent flavin oxidoreductase YrpB (nitropropane dioxygenase family)|nr:nitronate monooxygenase [Solirubrobacterales bacterium]
MPPLLERLGVELPVVQAGMGGGLSRHELAAAVSEAGGLGTIAVNGAAAIRRELAAARTLTGRPLAVNVLLPFARRDWFEAAAAADVVVTFWGKPRRRTPGVWLHQVGSLAEAREAQAAGADGVIVQGVEAGGHVRGTTPALELLEQVRAALSRGYPLLLAGGVAEPADVHTALEAGATAAVAGTRFLLSEESRAHALYKDRLLAADETLLTDLFGAAWPAPHRVVPNAATARVLGRRSSFQGLYRGKDERHPFLRAPSANRALNRVLAPGARYTPSSLQLRMMRGQRPGGRLLTPAGPTDDGPATLVDAGALYAGETVARIDTVRPAADLVRELSG